MLSDPACGDDNESSNQQEKDELQSDEIGKHDSDVKTNAQGLIFNIQNEKDFNYLKIVRIKAVKSRRSNLVVQIQPFGIALDSTGLIKYFL